MTVSQIFKKLMTVSSGSEGNCYLLFDGDGQAFMFDAGIDPRKVKKAIGGSVSSIKGIYITHSHKDHSKYAEYWRGRGKVVVEAYERGRGTDSCFRLFHDVECVGYVFQFAGVGNFAYITDTGKVPYVFKNLNHVLIEANYCEKMLESNESGGKIVPYLADRVRENHLSVQQVIEFLKKHDLSKLKTITICHISHTNGNNDYFKALIESEIGVPVRIAENGTTLDL